MPTEPSALVAGFDGCPKGWLGCLWLGPGHPPEAICLKSLGFAETVLPADTLAVAVDIPLGLLDVAVSGGRLCDQQARRHLGGRSSSVFSPPVRSALLAKDYVEACAINRRSGPEALGLSKQSFAIFPKLIDAKDAVNGSLWLREGLIEVHPELCFAMMAGTPLKNAKKRTAGKEERRHLLNESGFKNLAAFELAARQLGGSTDDALDACVAAWSAWRYAEKAALCLPDGAQGPHFSMRIWY